MPAARIAQRHARLGTASHGITIVPWVPILLWVVIASTSMAQQATPVRSPSDTRPTDFPGVPLTSPQHIALTQDRPDITRVPPVEEIPAPDSELDVPTDEPSSEIGRAHV